MTKRFLSLVLSVILILSMFPTVTFAEWTVSGSGTNDSPWLVGTPTNSNVKAYIDGTTLKISGTGAMMDFSTVSAPWWYLSYTKVEIESGVTSIGVKAFLNCSALQKVTIPSSVKSIGICAFQNCSELHTITIPNGVLSIGSKAFYGCSKLATASISKSVTSIGSQAFLGCTHLTSVSIGSGVSNIGFETFRSCTSLSCVSVQSETPPTLDNTAFQNCSGIRNICVPAGFAETYKSIGNWISYQDKIVDGTASNPWKVGVTNHESEVYAYIGGTTLCIKGNGNMESYSSENSYPWSLYSSSIETIIIDEGVTNIGNHAFKNFTKLTNVTIPASVSDIQSLAFNGCSKLAKIYLKGNNPPTLHEKGTIFYNSKNYKVYVPASVVETYKSNTDWDPYKELIVGAYPVTVAETSHGTVTASSNFEASGNNVNVTATPDSGYELKSLKWYTVSDVRHDITSSKSFTMPAAEVTIVSEFEKSDDPITGYNITVNGILVTTANCNDVLEDGKVTYNPDTNVLSVTDWSDGGLAINGNNTVDVDIDLKTNESISYLTVTNANNVSLSGNNSSSPMINGKVEIDCTGDVEINNIVSSADPLMVGWDPFLIKNAKNVTVMGNTSSILLNKTTINCTGNINIVNNGKGFAVGDNFTVTGAADVTVHADSNASPIISGNVDITCTGNVDIKNKTAINAPVIYGYLTITDANNVNISGNSSYGILNRSATINCSGNVTIENKGTGSVVNVYPLIITNAKDVAITAATSGNISVISEDAIISCTGDVTIKNETATDAPVIYGYLTITNANNVSISGNSNYGILNRSAAINCTGNVTIENKGTGSAVNINPLIITNASNVSVKARSSAPALSGAEIVCNGKVDLRNSGSGVISNAKLIINSATDVNIQAFSNTIVINNAEISCTGNVTIENKTATDAPVINGFLTITDANEITISGKIAGPLLCSADISSRGNVIIKNTGSGVALGKFEKIKYNRIPGYGNYAVKMGNLEADLVVKATKLESETYGPESCESNKIFAVVGTNLYNINAQAQGHGTASATDLNNANISRACPGASVKFTATPETGYEFDYWEVVSGGINLSPDDEATDAISVTMPNTALTLKAHFKKQIDTNYNVIIEVQGSHGTAKAQVGGADQTAVSPGSKVSLIAVADDGYRFKQWQILHGLSDEDISADNKFTMPANEVKVKAIFERVYNINLQSDGHADPLAMVDFQTVNVAAAGETVKLHYQNLDEGYEFKSFDVVSGTIEFDQIGNGFTMPAENVTIRMTFQKMEKPEPEDPEPEKPEIRKPKDTVVIEIGKKTEDEKEENPNTGAPVMEIISAAILCGSSLLLRKKH